MPSVHVPYGHVPPAVSSLAARDMLSPDISMSPDVSSGALEGGGVTGGDMNGEGGRSADDYSVTGRERSGGGGSVYDSLEGVDMTGGDVTGGGGEESTDDYSTPRRHSQKEGDESGGVVRDKWEEAKRMLGRGEITREVPLNTKQSRKQLIPQIRNSKSRSDYALGAPKP